MLRIAALLSFALVITLVGGAMTLDTDMQAGEAVVYAQESN